MLRCLSNQSGLGNDTLLLSKGTGHDIVTDFNSGNHIIPIESDWKVGSSFIRATKDAIIFDECGDLLPIFQKVYVN